MCPNVSVLASPAVAAARFLAATFFPAALLLAPGPADAVRRDVVARLLVTRPAALLLLAVDLRTGAFLRAPAARFLVA